MHVESLPVSRGFAMGQTGEYPPVTEQLLGEVVRRVLLAGSPHAIVLFGSRARGDGRADSDLDLLIIEDSDLPRYERSPRYYHALTGIFPAKDIVVYTPDEVKEWSDVPNAFVTAALREGRVLHGNAGRSARGWMNKGDSDRLNANRTIADIRSLRYCVLPRPAGGREVPESRTRTSRVTDPSLA